MNILFFTTEYNHIKTPNCGGIGTFISLMSKQLTLKGHKVYVFGFNNKEIDFFDNDISVKFFKKRSYYRLNKILMFFLSQEKTFFFKENLDRLYITYKLKKYIKNKKIDIIEAYDYRGFFKYFKFLKTPIVIRCHGSLGLLKKNFGYQYIDDKIIEIENQAFKNYDNIIAVSSYSKKINSKLYNKENIRIIYNGIDKDFFKKDKNIEIINHSIYYFGTITKHKGIDVVFEVFSIIKKDYPNTSLHLIGRGHEYLDTLLLKYQNIKDSIFYYGILSPNNLVRELSKSQVIIFPTKGENFPFSFLEAMSMEKPVIVSDICVSKEIITNNVDGFIASSNKQFVNIIKEIFEGNKKNVSKKAREKIKNSFTVEKMVLDSVEYYKSIINEK